MKPLSGLAISVDDRRSDRVHVSLVGDVDIENASTLRRLLESHFADGAPHIVLEMSAVGFIDSLGIGALVAGLRLAWKLDAKLSIANPHRRVAAALRLAGIDTAFASIDESDEDGFIA